MPDLPKDHKNPGHTSPADAGHGLGSRADGGVKVTVVASVPPSLIVVGLGARAPVREVTQNNVAGQSVGSGLPRNVSIG